MSQTDGRTVQGRAGERSAAGPFGLGRPWSLRTQLIAGNIVALTLLLGALGLVVRFTVSSLLLSSVDRRLRSAVEFGPPAFGHSPPGGGGGQNGGAMSPPPGGPPPSGSGSGSGPGDDPGGGPGGSPGGPGNGPSDSGGGGDYGDPGGDPGGGPDDSPRGRTTVHVRRGAAAASLARNRDGDGDTFAVRHFDRAGHPLGGRQVLDATALALVAAGTRSECFSRANVDGEPLEVFTTVLHHQGGPGGGDGSDGGGGSNVIAQAGSPLKEIDQAIEDMDAALLLLIPVGLLGAGAAGAALTARVLRRVRDTARAAEQIGVSQEGALSARLPVVGEDEFAGLAGTFNDLLGRLDGAFERQRALLEQQRRFTADASHELKTPLTIIQGTSSMMADREEATAAEYQRSFRRISQASESMARLVQDLLLLARSDSGQLGRSPITLLARDIVRQAAASIAPAGGAVPAQPAVRIDVPDDTLAVAGSETELVRVFSNLLGNAVRCTPAEGGLVVVSAHRRGDKQVVFIVADNGIGIAPEHLPHLGERFYRVDSARSRTDGGSGLGLSICRSIVEAHGGTMRIESQVGVGTTVTVTLSAG